MTPNIPFIEKGNHGKGMFASELASSMKVSRPGITNILKALVEKGLVEQIEDASDRRRKRLLLTAFGAQMIEEMEPIRKEANGAFLSQLEVEEKEQFLSFIQRCSKYAKEQLENPEALTQNAP